ncbi:Alpha-xylosidase A [Hypsizygus marmoreus]|uniref:Alpha-xylosidase A n=1 Tax=Hypsizygus marmoreus TaxID=39966 RepID=A0A369JD88_HYPMA|nr:Alpha-xylosidase A [Hypsizygus marmoreus]
MFGNTLTLLAATDALLAATNSSYFRPNSTGIKLQNGFERVYIQPFGNHGIRVRASLSRDPTGNEPSALLDPPLEGPGGNEGLTHDINLPFQGSASLRNGNLIAQVSLGVLSFLRAERNGSNTLLTSEYIDAKALPARYYVQDFRSSSFAARFAFTSTPDEQFYGTGQQACCKDHSVNKKGQVVDLINYNSHVTLPVYMSNKGYLQFFNMPSQGRIEFSPLRTRFETDEATVVDYYFTTAEPGDYDALQEQYTAVTGRQPAPPDFMLGYQQSKLRYYNESQVLNLARRFHDEKVNVSLIVIDFFAWKFQGDWSFDPQFFPDPAGMAATVKRLTGAEMMVSLWPSVEDLSVNYLMLQENGLLATTRDGPGVQDSFKGVYTRLVDSTNPAAREFIFISRREYTTFGSTKQMAAHWANLLRIVRPINVMNFGASVHLFLDGQTISSIPYARSFAQYFIGTQEATGKIYPWLHQQAIEEGLRNLTGVDTKATSCQYMSLTRSTFAGGQRFCSYLWSGDTDSRFDVLLQQITSGVSVTASGISAWTLDIGGFAGLDIDTAEGRELFVRWFGMGVFLPFTRVHGYVANFRFGFVEIRHNIIEPGVVISQGTPFLLMPIPPWSYGEENFIIIKKYIELRYQLVPYVKKLFEMLQKTGKTIMRPLYFDFSHSDPFIAEATGVNNPLIVHQYMFGPRLLVAPVGEPNATMKEVYLPRLPGPLVAQKLTWTHWWSEKEFGAGGKFINISAHLDEIPVFYLGNKEDILQGSF